MKLPLLSSGVALCILPLSATAEVQIDWVEIGNINNPSQNATNRQHGNNSLDGRGSVGYLYHTSRNEITVGNYVEFLNAKAKSDPYGLYNAKMASPDWDAILPFISRDGTDGNYTYTAAAGRENDPVVYVSWFDAARFANWLANGQGNATTETGSYDLNGAMSGYIERRGDATIALPTLDEWHKAGFYDPSGNSGAGVYWKFSTRTNATIDNILGNPGAANFLIAYGDPLGTKSGGQMNSLATQITPAGFYSTSSQSHYGTNDQSGNVTEWTDQIAILPEDVKTRIVRGGAFNGWQSTAAENHDSTYEHQHVGFRLVDVTPTAGQQVAMDWITVGDLGNPAQNETNRDHEYGGGDNRGSVSYEYKISRNEATVGQYIEFLNAKAKSDPYGLYNESMAGTQFTPALIVRMGTDGNYRYVGTGHNDEPVIFVSWFDSARFINWLQNGQGSGDTETGAYELDGAISGVIISKSPSAAIWLPTADEWYKAAYYDPAKNAGNGGYWLYAIQDDELWGNKIGWEQAANYHDGASAKTVNELDSPLTPVGVYGTGSQSHYGTNDQGGNVFEWTDEVNSGMKILRGGSWDGGEFYMRSSSIRVFAPEKEDNYIGFRLVTTGTPGGYAAWALAAQLDDTNNGPTADPDHDGIDNILEYYLNGNPLLRDTNILPQSELAGGYFTLGFDRLASAANELADQALEYSETMDTWTSVSIPLSSTGPDENGITCTITDLPGGIQHVEFSLAPPPGGRDRLFVRLRVGN